MKRRRNTRRRMSRLDRIERKCDRILSELLILRHKSVSGLTDLDAAIERMHVAARRMRAACETERDSARKILAEKFPGL